MNARSIILAAMTTVRFVVDLFAVVIALGFLAMFALEFFHAPRIESSYVIVHVHRFGDPAVRWVSHWFGWHWPTAGRNYAPLIVAVAIFFGKSIVDDVLTRIEFVVGRSVKSTKPPRASAQGGKAAPAKLAAETEKDREVLLKRFREIEATLKGAARKQCSFLSIDVVGSTKMKIGERA
ncbi:MAG TPA: hypothetical protein VNF68_05175, partial [Candidatus Baltobacteraceae bacterium]|nr:hypothetical protein [Candidatus Baltobacteraceae bacterium]